jgi:hypothetical protein
VLLLAHEIRWVRNSVVHETIPLFKPIDERFFEMSVVKSRKGRPRYATLRLERSEVSGLEGHRSGRGRRTSTAELTAYFCVSRTRMILQSLFDEPEMEAKTSDESGGSLLLWQES